jgi:Tol biopolymer transport system component
MANMWSAVAAVASALGFAVPLSVGSGLPASTGPTGRIIFNSTGDIYSVSPAGTGRVKLTSGSGEKYAGSYSRPLRRIAFVRGGISGRLWSMREDGSDARPVGAASLIGSCPRYSPQGGRIAYRAGEFGEIHVVNSDGTGGRKVSGSDTVFDQCPSWSPDGRRLAFVRYSSFSSSDVWTMRANGTDAVQLTADGEIKTTAAWSPDSRSIAFDRGGDIWVMAASGASQRQLTHTPAYESDPVWSPRSDLIAHAYAQGSAFELRITEAHGKYTRAVGVSGSPAAWRS